jgi:ATP-dependent helicase/nuclease subunit A
MVMTLKREFTDAQKEARDSFNINTIVSAGAGSGKTSVLVARYLQLLSRGMADDSLNAHEILAITFTRKAATEMRTRIRKGIYDKIASDTQNEAYWRKQLAYLDRAQIGTIHSFCSSILRSNPVESNLDPAFSIAEERDADEFLATHIREFLRLELRKQDADAVLLANEYGSANFLSELLQLWHGNALPEQTEDLTLPYTKALQDAAAAKEYVLELLTHAEDELTPAHYAIIAEQGTRFEEVLRAQEIEASDLEELQQILDLLNLRSSKDKAYIKDLKEHFALVMSIPLLEKAQTILPSWQRFITALQKYLYEQKTESSTLSFDDLEIRALNLLKDNPQVLQKCQKRYKQIMVDEFQDTNERQRQLIYLLAGGNADKLGGNSLFVVGDPKQSIYRFRGAEVQVFAKVRQEIKAMGGKDIVLDQNFRSTNKVVALCNHIFECLLGATRQSNIAYEALTTTKESEVMPHLWLINYPKEDSLLEREMEAELTAQEIIRLHEEEKLPFADINVLFSTMASVNIFADIFQQAGIPYKIVDGRGFYERQEILDLINLLKVLVNPADNVALTGILRSPYFGIPDTILTNLYLGMGNTETLWDKLLHAPDKLLQRAAKKLCYLHQEAVGLSLPDLSIAIAKTLEPETVLLLQENGQERLANYQKFMDMGADFAAQGFGTLSSWLAQVVDLRENGVRESAATVEAEDAVTIMTIHKAKGLEADTVFVPRLDAGTDSDKDTIKYVAGQGLGISVCNEQESLEPTSVLQQFKEQNKQLEAEEKSRLLYVAMTRAQKRLYLLGGKKQVKKQQEKANGWVGDLQELLPDDGKYIEFREMDTSETIDIPHLELTATVPAQINTQLLQDLPGYGLHNSTYFSASTLQEYIYCPRRYYYEVVEKIPPMQEVNIQGMNALAPADAGSLAHKVLELYDGNNFQEVYASAVREFAHGNKTLAEPVRAMLQKYIASPLYKELSQKERQAEYRLQMPLGTKQELFLTGYIDVLATNADGTCDIIDYKTGRPPEGEPALGYAYQLALYVEAAQTLWQKKVRKAELHYLQNCTAWVLPQDRDYLQEAVALCEEIAAKKIEADYAPKEEHCKLCPFVYMCRH